MPAENASSSLTVMPSETRTHASDAPDGMSARKRSTVSSIRASCSLICSSALLPTRRTACRYPYMPDESESGIRLGASTRSERTVPGSPIRQTPIGYERTSMSSVAQPPKQSEYVRQRRITPRTSSAHSCPMPSAQSFDAARFTPESAKVEKKPYAEVISEKSPTPPAPSTPVI